MENLSFFLTDVWFCQQAFATTTVLFQGTLCSASGDASPPNWLDPAVIERFNHAECQESRTWETIAEQYASTPWLFSSGGLGTAVTREFRVWACWQGHSCLSRIAGASQASDAMCYVYHETQKTWLPWCLGHELSICSSLHSDDNSTSSTSENSTDVDSVNSTKDDENAANGSYFNSTWEDDTFESSAHGNSTLSSNQLETSHLTTIYTSRHLQIASLN
jgi:hypothetical protein